MVGQLAIGPHIWEESILPAKIISRCSSLVLLGAGIVLGVNGKPLFTGTHVVWHHLHRLHRCCEARYD